MKPAPHLAWSALPESTTVLLRSLTKPRQTTVCLGCVREFSLDAGPYWTWRTGYCCDETCQTAVRCNAWKAATAMEDGDDNP